jgi:hypothetical protein
MGIRHVALRAAIGLLLCAAVLTAPATQRRPAALRISDLPGTYELVERVLADGRVLRRPAIAGLYSWGHGRASLNLFLRRDDGSLASESSIIRYSLDDKEYCEWIEFTIRNNLDAPGVTNEAPPVTSHCTPVKLDGGKAVFAPPGESVTTIYERNGFTAVIAGEFTDHWRRIG